MFDIILASCKDHSVLEDTIKGEGLYAHYPLDDEYCHCLVSEFQLKILDSNKIKYNSPSELPLVFKNKGVVRHTFGSKIRERTREREISPRSLNNTRLTVRSEE